MIIKFLNLLFAGILTVSPLSYDGYNIPEANILSAYNNAKVRILIVPGHDNDPSSGGTEYFGLKEADLNVDLAENLIKILKTDDHFEVFTTRDKNGYKEPFASYFITEREKIIEYRETAKARMRESVNQGRIIPIITDRPDTSDENSIRLYGINNWATDNQIDIILHIHFNDYGSRRANRPGLYSGLAIYVPEKQMPNAGTSLGFAIPIFNQLAKFFPVSNQLQERFGIIEDQELIAVGANTNLKSSIASVLIEYGYIYESAWFRTSTRPMVLKELAYQTYVGIKKYFGSNQEYYSFNQLPKPYMWTKSIPIGTKSNPDILALQIALTRNNLYPPAVLSRNDCPLSGTFGNCTYRSLRRFQGIYGLPQTGQMDTSTLKKLNAVYQYSVHELLLD